MEKGIIYQPLPNEKIRIEHNIALSVPRSIYEEKREELENKVKKYLAGLWGENDNVSFEFYTPQKVGEQEGEMGEGIKVKLEIYEARVAVVVKYAKEVDSFLKILKE